VSFESYIPVADYVQLVQPAEEVICTACGHTRLDIDAAVSQYPTVCPECGDVAVDPHYILVEEVPGEAA
jgi:rubrerythrin